MKLPFPNTLRPVLDHPELPVRLFLVYLIVLCPTHGRIIPLIKFELVTLCIAGIIVHSLPRRWEFWGVVSTLLVINLRYNFRHSANHYFLTLYPCTILAVVAFRRQHGELPAFNMVRVLLTITFGFAALHKLLSIHFMSGRLLASYFLRGKTFRQPLDWLYPNYQETAANYQASLDKLGGDPTLMSVGVPIDIPEPSFIGLCVALTASIGVLELVMFGLMLSRRAFYSSWFPFAMLAFVWGTFLFRNELTFFALLCILTLLAAGSSAETETPSAESESSGDERTQRPGPSDPPGRSTRRLAGRLLLAGSSVVFLALSLNRIYLRF